MSNISLFNPHIKFTLNRTNLKWIILNSNKVQRYNIGFGEQVSVDVLILLIEEYCIYKPWLCVWTGYRKAVVLDVTAEETSRTLTVEGALPPSQQTRPFTPLRAHQHPACPSHTSPLCSPPWVSLANHCIVIEYVNTYFIPYYHTTYHISIDTDVK